jgi:SnoaL-like domain
MTNDDLDRWLQAYGQAWIDRDPEAAVRLFAEDVTYHETPFDEPARGIDGVRRYWAENTDVQREIVFRYEILALEGSRGIARWWAEYVRPATRVRARLDGILVLEFAPDGRCRRLEEWWHRHEA